MGPRATAATAARTNNLYYGTHGGGVLIAYGVNVVNFKGMSTRREYWWVQGIGAVVAAILAYWSPAWSGNWCWGLLVSGLGLTVRRYRDAGVAWWWALVLLALAVFGVRWQHGWIGISLALLALIANLVICGLPTDDG